MKINKLLLVAAMAVFAGSFVACDEDDNYAPGKPAGSYDVAFVDPGSIVLAKTATEFELTMVRADKSGEIAVPIEIVKLGTGFQVPSTVNFPAGADTVTFTVKLPETMDLNSPYDFMIRVAESFTNPYVLQENVPQCFITVAKEDYDVAYTGTYYDQFLYAGDDVATWEVVVEYSPSLDLYRIQDIFPEGDALFFSWDQETNKIVTTDATGNEKSLMETGEMYDEENRIVVYTDEGDFYYDPAEKTIHLPFYWYVLPLDGGWGIYENVVILD